MPFSVLVPVSGVPSGCRCLSYAAGFTSDQSVLPGHRDDVAGPPQAAASGTAGRDETTRLRGVLRSLSLATTLSAIPLDTRKALMCTSHRFVVTVQFILYVFATQHFLSSCFSYHPRLPLHCLRHELQCSRAAA